MKKHVLTKSLIGFLTGATMLMAPCMATAAAPVPSGADDCARELLLSYFPEPIVKETLKKFAVPQEKWTAITDSLSNKDKDVVKLVEQKAASLNPNPLKDPQQRQAAVKLFRETLLQVFSDALKENGITDSHNYQAMLDDIQQQKAKKFAMCMEKQKNQAQQAEDADANDDDSDDSDEEDSDADANDDDSEDDETDDTDEADDADKAKDAESTKEHKEQTQPAAK